MTAYLQIGFFMLAAIAVVAVAANRFHAPSSIFLVLAGAALALVPGLPRVELMPELVLMLVLPPLIYSAGISMSWREFRYNLRPIALLAIGCVVFTTVAVAASLHWLLGWPWAIGFVLGAIVAPPDVVAPLAIARRLGLPRRLRIILEGEGLANDATALILYRFAVAAVSTGVFSLGDATMLFGAILIGEIAYGIGIGSVMLRLRHAARDPRVEILLSLLTPYIAFWLPSEIGGSGVLATIAAGLYVSWNGPRLISSATRLQGIFFWDLVIYLIEGFVFLLTGLQARIILERASSLQHEEILVAALATVVVVIAARFIWVFPATYVPRWVSPALARRDPTPKWQFPFILAFTGIRGVVSLAAALAIPLVTAAGEPFPNRDIILAVTFIVIVVTLVGQGLSLPGIVKRLGLADDVATEREQEQVDEHMARSQAVRATLARLERLAEEQTISPGLFDELRAHHSARLRQLERARESPDLRRLAEEAHLDLIDAERRFLYEALRDGKIRDESRRRLERELDLKEAQIARGTGIEGGGV